MRLTEQQITMIEKYLEKDRIFYDDIRMEMTDHIATTLEEHLTDGDDFDAALGAYMNSHLKVKLLTAAKEQEVLRDKSCRGLIFKQLVSKRGIIFFMIVFSILMISTFEVWIFRAFELILIVILLSYMLAEPWMPKKYLFIKRLHDVSAIYHFIPVFFVLRINKIFGEDQWVYCISGLLLSVIYTVYYLAARMNYQILKNKKYA